MKVKDIVSAINAACPPPPSPLRPNGNPLEHHSCDTLHAGSMDAEVHRIASVFMADVEVVRRAAALNVDLIITHEPTFHTGQDDQTGWLKGNPVYENKMRLIEDNRISIWRCHDVMHMVTPDLIYVGWMKELGWEKYLVKGSNCYHYRLPEMTLGKLIDFFKQKLDMDTIRYIGDLDRMVSDIGVLVGGGSLGLGDENMPAKYMSENGIEVLVCGETTEWTSCSFVRDASMLGMNRNMVILGHNKTEEAGMKHFHEWLQPLVGDIPICFISSGEPFQYC